MRDHPGFTLYLPRECDRQTPIRSLLAHSVVGLLSASCEPVLRRLERVSDGVASALADLLFGDDRWRSCYVSLLAMPDGSIELTDVAGDSDLPVIPDSPDSPPPSFIEAQCRANMAAFEKVQQMSPQPDYMVVVLAARCHHGVLARYDFRSLCGRHVEVVELPPNFS